jgi:predicted nucleotidyltransferase
VYVKHQKPLHLNLAHRIANMFSVFPNVEAIALAGSQTVGVIDQDSDIDLYVYTRSVISLSDRVAIVEKLGATRSDLNLQFWDLGDEWYDAKTGIEVDIIYWDTSWIEGQLDRVIVEHQANTGYSTCFWHTILNSQILYDKNGWLYRLKGKSMVPFPEALRRAIVEKNHPILRRVIPSYLHQIEKAIRRDDLLSINHRVAALLASYFDVLFALNRLPNPGEKQLLKIVADRCVKVPEEMVIQVERVLHASSSADQNLIVSIEELIDSLDELLREEGFDPETSLPVPK